VALKLPEGIRSELRSVTIGSAARVDTRGPVQGARVSHPSTKAASAAGFSMGGMCPQSGTMRNSAPGMFEDAFVAVHGTEIAALELGSRRGRGLTDLVPQAEH